MKKYSLKYGGKCKVCGKHLGSGTMAWMQKNPTFGRWDIFCVECVDEGGFGVTPPVKLPTPPTAHSEAAEPAPPPPPIPKPPPIPNKGPKMTMDYIKENAAWRLEVCI